MADEQSYQIALVTRSNSDMVFVVPRCKQQLVHVRLGVLLECQSNDAENHVGHLVLPEGELNLIPRIAAGGSELK